MSKKMNLNFYKNFYKLYFSKYTDSQIKGYWEEYGRNNSSIPNKEYLLKVSKFNWHFYVENNSDLPIFKDESEYFNHWYSKGIFENRLYYFDSNYYQKLYPDLNNEQFSEEILLAHWYLIGKNEGRVCCSQDFTKLEDLDLKIKNEDLNNFLKKKKKLEKLETDNAIKKSKLEKEILGLTSQFLNAEEKKISIRKETIEGYYKQQLLSIKNKNTELESVLEAKEAQKIQKSCSHIKRHNEQLSLQIEKENRELRLKINDLTQKNLGIIHQKMKKNINEIENERLNYEIDLNNKNLILKEQELTKKKIYS